MIVKFCHLFDYTNVAVIKAKQYQYLLKYIQALVQKHYLPLLLHHIQIICLLLVLLSQLYDHLRYHRHSNLHLLQNLLKLVIRLLIIDSRDKLHYVESIFKTFNISHIYCCLFPGYGSRMWRRKSSARRYAVTWSSSISAFHTSSVNSLGPASAHYPDPGIVMFLIILTNSSISTAETLFVLE